MKRRETRWEGISYRQGKEERQGGREYPTDNEKKRDKVGGNILQTMKRRETRWEGIS